MPGYSKMPFIILQTNVLDEGAKHHRDSWWWVKADGCDLISGLAESTRGICYAQLWSNCTTNLKLWSGKKREFHSGLIFMFQKFIQLHTAHFRSVKTKLMF